MGEAAPGSLEQALDQAMQLPSTLQPPQVPPGAGGQPGRRLGVTRHKRTQRYEAHIWLDKKQEGVYLGAFDAEGQAARAHDVMALRTKGPGTPLNFPRPDYTALLPFLAQRPQAEVVAALRSYSKSLSLNKRGGGGGGSSVRSGGAAAAAAAAPARKRRRRSPSPEDVDVDYWEAGQAGGVAWGAIAGSPAGMPGAPPYATRRRRAAAAATAAGAPESEGEGDQGLAAQQGSPFLPLSIEPLHVGALERPPPIRTSPPHAATGRPGMEGAAPLPAGRAASLAQLQQRALSTAGSLGGAGPQTPLSPASSLGVKNLLALANQQPAGSLASALSGHLPPAGSMPPPPPVRMVARGTPGLAAAAAPEQQQQQLGAVAGMPALPQLGLAPLGGLAMEGALPSQLLPGQLPALPGLLGEGFSVAHSGLQPTTLLGPWGLPPMPEAWPPHPASTTPPTLLHHQAEEAGLLAGSPLQQKQPASTGQQQQEEEVQQTQQQVQQRPAEGSQGQPASHPATAAPEPTGATVAGQSAAHHGSAAPVGTDAAPATPMPLLPSPLATALPLLAPGALVPPAAWPAGWVPQQGAALSPVTPAAGGHSRAVHAQLQQILGGILPPDMAARAAQELISLEAALQASHAVPLAQPQPQQPQASHATTLAQVQPPPPQSSQAAALAQPQPAREVAQPGALAEPPVVPGGAE